MIRTNAGIGRRMFMAGGILGVGLGAFNPAGAARVLARQSLHGAKGQRVGFVYVGTHGDNIYGARFDTETGLLTPLDQPVMAPSTNWIVGHPHLPFLYAASGAPGGLIYRLAQDPLQGALTRLDMVSEGRGGFSYLCLDPASQMLLASNYGAGDVIGIPIASDGTTPAITSVVATQGSGPNPRQASAHPHGVAVAPGGTHVLVPDLGADRVFIIGFNPRERRLLAPAQGGLSSFALPAGSGPRHIAFHPSGRFVFLINELTAMLDVLAWNGRQGTLSLLQSVSTTAPGFTGTLSAAELAVSADGRFVYTSNRGDNTLVVHGFDSGSGTLHLVQKIPCGGQSPWAFAIHPGGRWLLVTNDASSTVNVFRIDAVSGRLLAMDKAMSVPRPACVTFF